MKSLVAGVQYDDWKGTSTADNSDSNRVRDYLASNGHRISPGDLVAIEMSIGDNQGEHRDPVWVTFIIADSRNEGSAADDIPHYHEVPLEMQIADFLGLFKRFDVVLKTRSRSVPDEYVALPETG